jgi:hypothetical protein
MLLVHADFPLLKCLMCLEFRKDLSLIVNPDLYWIESKSCVIMFFSIQDLETQLSSPNFYGRGTVGGCWGKMI